MLTARAAPLAARAASKGFMLRKVFGIITALAVLLTLYCGEPSDYLDSKWERIAAFPDGALPRKVACGNAGFFIIGVMRNESEDEVDVIWRWNGSILTEDYISPYKEPKRILNDIACNENVGWAVGKEADKSGMRDHPFLAWKRAADAGWEEIPITNTGVSGLTQVFPMGRYSCLLNMETISSEKYICKYANGEVTIWPERRFIWAYAPLAGTIFARDDPRAVPNNNHLYISTDEGQTWATETITCQGIPPDIELGAATASGHSLYFIVHNPAMGDGYGIVERSGSPGAGDYKLLFYCNKNPYCTELRALARDHVGKVMAVGHDTTVYCDGHDWLIEEQPYRYLYDVCPAVESDIGGFFALGSHYGDWLLYHP